MIELSDNILFDNSIWAWGIPVYLGILAILLKIWGDKIRSISEILQHTSKNIYRYPINPIHIKSTKDSDITKTTISSIKKYILFSIFGSLILLSLAQPYRLGPELPKPQQYRDIVFIVDSSVNMVLRDYVVNDQRIDRMSMLKIVLNHFIKQLDGIGLAVGENLGHQIS